MSSPSLALFRVSSSYSRCSIVSLRRALSHLGASSSSSSFHFSPLTTSRQTSLSSSSSGTGARETKKRASSTIQKGFFRETSSSPSSLGGDENEYSSPADVFSENDRGEPVYFGRRNKSQLKRDANRLKTLADQLLAISPKTLKKLHPNFIASESLMEGLLECQKTTSHIAKKRAEQRVAKQLRALEEEELKPLEEVIERVKLGTDGGLGAVDPMADDLARDWRRRITMVGEDEKVAATRKEALEEVFGVMQRAEESEMNAVSFTRQELADVARKAETEAKETALKSDEFADRRRREAMGEIVFMDDVDEEAGEEVFLLKKGKGNAAGSKKKKGKKTSAMKSLLKMLRDIAERAV